MPHDACTQQQLSPIAQVSPLLMTTQGSLPTFMPRPGRCPAPFAEGVFVDRRVLAMTLSATSTFPHSAAWMGLAKRLTNVLNDITLSLHAPTHAPTRLVFTAGAVDHWTLMTQKMQTTIAQKLKDQEVDHIPHDTYQPILAARFAALLTIAENPKHTYVDVDTLKMGECLAKISAEAYQQIVSAPPQEEQDAMELYEWLSDPENSHYFPVRFTTLEAEGPVNAEKDLWMALLILKQQNSIELQWHGDVLYVDLATPHSPTTQTNHFSGYAPGTPAMSQPPMAYQNTFPQGHVTSHWHRHDAGGYQPPSFQSAYHGYNGAFRTA